MIIGPGEPRKDERAAKPGKQKRKGGKAKKRKAGAAAGTDAVDPPAASADDQAPTDAVGPPAASADDQAPTDDGDRPSVSDGAAPPTADGPSVTSAGGPPPPVAAAPPPVAARTASGRPPSSGDAARAGAVVDRIDALRERVGTLIAIADGRAAPERPGTPAAGGLASRAASPPTPSEVPVGRAGGPPDGGDGTGGLADADDPAHAGTGPSGGRVVPAAVFPVPDAGPVDPLTRPVAPIPAAIAAALSGRPAPDAPGHRPTPGVADPPDGPTTHGRSSAVPAHAAPEPAAPGHAAPTGPAPWAASAGPTASAVLVARELLSGGMDPADVGVRLRDAYGVVDADAVLAAAC